MVINVVDSIMGSGKTQAAINYIKNSKFNEKFIYITPYLDEVERIIKSCPNQKFKQPKSYNNNISKLSNLKTLLNKGENIATTHSLFHLFDEEIIDLCYSQKYILFLDEVTDVIDTYYLGKDDLHTLLETYVNVEDNGILKWKEEKKNYQDEKFLKEKRLCEMECLALYGNEIMMWMFPVKVFKAFHKSFILTYMFESQVQCYYYKFYGLEYNSMYVSGDNYNEYKISEVPNKQQIKYDYKSLIHIIEDTKLNLIGDFDSALSKTWYARNKDNNLMIQLKNNVGNFFKHKIDVSYSKSDNNLWTTFKEYKSKIQGKGYTKGYIPLNLRSSNAYKERTSVAYLVNRYFNPLVKHFFEKNNIKVYEEGYALSEMLQFLWRSGIREGKEITVYIPSKRMRNLLIWWMEEMEMKKNE